jgi:hypothetical protein
MCLQANIMVRVLEIQPASGGTYKVDVRDNDANTDATVCVLTQESLLSYMLDHSTMLHRHHMHPYHCMYALHIHNSCCCITEYLPVYLCFVMYISQMRLWRHNDALIVELQNARDANKDIILSDIHACG